MAYDSLSCKVFVDPGLTGTDVASSIAEYLSGTADNFDKAHCPKSGGDISGRYGGTITVKVKDEEADHSEYLRQVHGPQ